MMWKERYVSRTGVTTKAVAGVLVVAVAGLVGYLLYDSAKPAFAELMTYGYGAPSGNRARTDLNSLLRGLGVAIYLLWLLGVASAAAGGLTAEREEDTWTSLVATPLDGEEIVRAKLFGALWGTRWIGFLMLILWLVGLVAGAVHPFGFVALIVESAVFLGFTAALGTHVSLRSRSSGRALLATISILLVLNGGYMICCIPLRPSTTFIAMGATPWIEIISLVTYEDVRALFHGQGSWSGQVHRDREAAAACLFGVIAYGMAALVLCQRTVARFDEEVDRPRRGNALAFRPPKVLDDEVGDKDETISPNGKE